MSQLQRFLLEAGRMPAVPGVRRRFQAASSRLKACSVGVFAVFVLGVLLLGVFLRFTVSAACHND